MSAAGSVSAVSGGGILAQIVARRRARVDREGHAAGMLLPARREGQPVAFGADPFLVCEVKRRSPSRGEIDGTDPVERARRYAAHGVRSISVLTEQDHFGGSLEDLVRIKAALPAVAVLRKDFLLDEEDVEVSWRAGADAVLLIASVLDEATLALLHERARTLGLAALVEVHDEEDIAKCRRLRPGLVGINSRDLATFAVDIGRPLALAPRIDWPTRLVFESGIRFPEDVALAFGSGFSGVLVGETAMKAPERVPALLAAIAGPRARGSFWQRILARRRPRRPLVKVCGITRPGDAAKAAALGADALGFVFAPSKRRAGAALLRELRGLEVPKVAVVVTPTGDGAAGSTAGGERRLAPEVAGLLADGLVDAVQLHGDERPEECALLAFPYYKAVRLRDAEAVDAARRYRCPRVLADAWVPGTPGGTGRRAAPELAAAMRAAGPLWLAGGIGPDNVAAVMEALDPELVDCSSSLEESPGVKDHVKLQRLFEEIERHAG